MKQTITRSMFHDAFRDMDRKENFSYEGLNALFNYLDEYENDSCVEIELDVISLCCEFDEESIKSVLKNYNLESLDDLKNETCVVWHDDENVLYQIY